MLTCEVQRWSGYLFPPGPTLYAQLMQPSAVCDEQTFKWFHSSRVKKRCVFPNVKQILPILEKGGRERVQGLDMFSFGSKQKRLRKKDLLPTSR